MQPAPHSLGSTSSPNQIASLLAQHQPGFSLPRSLYVEPWSYELDMETVFANEWLFVCNVCEVPEPGCFMRVDIGRNSIVVLCGTDQRVRAFHNVCRHRGSLVCREETGKARRLVCPYHQWVYELDGTLRNARHMPPDFDASQFGLKPVKTEVICGLVYISLADDPPDLAPFREAVTPYIAPHRPERTKVAFATTIIEEANWKLVIENNRECYHCAANHPELTVSLVEYNLPDDPRGTDTFRRLMQQSAAKWDLLGLPHAPTSSNEFRCIRLPFNQGATSFTRDGAPACRKLLGDLTEPDLGSVRMYHAPNNWNHFLADHIIHFRVLPLAVDRTALRTTWLVQKDAVEGVDYTIDKLTEVWIATNDQDSRLASNNHSGIRSQAYAAGPYAPSEMMLVQFTDWYKQRLRVFTSRP